MTSHDQLAYHPEGDEAPIVTALIAALTATPNTVRIVAPDAIHGGTHGGAPAIAHGVP